MSEEVLVVTEYGKNCDFPAATSRSSCQKFTHIYSKRQTTDRTERPVIQTFEIRDMYGYQLVNPNMKHYIHYFELNQNCVS